MSEVNLERIIGRRVVDVSGQKVGRIEEVIAERIDGELVVTEYHVGRFALAERLSFYHFANWIVRRFGARADSLNVLEIPWDKLDLADPEHPRLTCARAEL
jgi:sporulation protein YlmC with PRC-barrel domain